MKIAATACTSTGRVVVAHPAARPPSTIPAPINNMEMATVRQRTIEPVSTGRSEDRLWDEMGKDGRTSSGVAGGAQRLGAPDGTRHRPDAQRALLNWPVSRSSPTAAV